jgi:ubiquinone/menaquinone biosynthesis C-methylase UbiE
MVDQKLTSHKTIHTQQHATFFSTREWAECWSSVFSGEVFEISVLGDGPPRTMNFIKTRLSYGLSDLSSGHSWDFCLSPGWSDTFNDSTVRFIFNQIPWRRTRSFTWKVRFDHAPLANSLTALDLKHFVIPVHILNLEADYDRVFRRFSPTTRNKIRKAFRRGVVVRNTSEPTDILKYQRIYSSLANTKGWEFVYPAEITAALLRGSNPARFVVAEFEGMVIGGALFIRDGNSVYYMHGVGNREFNQLSATRAVLAAGIEWACQIGADFINFGNSGSNSDNSLAFFKSRWGTHIEHDWVFTWRNPIWDKAAQVKRRAQRMQILRPKPTPPDGARISNETPWSQRAKLGELRAVLAVNGTERQLLMIHGAGLVAAKRALSMSGEQRGRRPVVLDFGCGTGRMVRFFGEHGRDVLGLEVTIEMLKEAKKFGPSTAWLSHFDGLSIPVKDCSIDLLWVCGVLKYTLFPPTTKNRAGILDVDKVNLRKVNLEGANATVAVFVPTYSEVAREMYRVLKPGGIVAQCEMFVDQQPEVFTRDFEKAGFLNERISIVRRYTGRLERLCEWRDAVWLPPGFVLLMAQACANLRYWCDNPYTRGKDFRDYFFVWRKPQPDPIGWSK